MNEDCLVNSLYKHIGETVTIFTVSGGISGSGFTGVLAAVGNGSIKLISQFGGRPACPIGSNCNCVGSYRRGGYGESFLGAVTVIPVDKIVSFTHNAV